MENVDWLGSKIWVALGAFLLEDLISHRLFSPIFCSIPSLTRFLLFCF